MIGRYRYSPLNWYSNSLGNLSRLDVVDFLYSVQGSVCLICSRYLRKAEATIDHVVPRRRGGPHHILNWALAHQACNHAKGHRWPTAEELARHARLVSKIQRALFWMRLVAPLIRLRKRILGVVHARRR